MAIMWGDIGRGFAGAQREEAAWHKEQTAKAHWLRVGNAMNAGQALWDNRNVKVDDVEEFARWVIDNGWANTVTEASHLASGSDADRRDTKAALRSMLTEPGATLETARQQLFGAEAPTEATLETNHLKLITDAVLGLPSIGPHMSGPDQQNLKRTFKDNVRRAYADAGYGTLSPEEKRAKTMEAAAAGMPHLDMTGPQYGAFLRGDTPAPAALADDFYFRSPIDYGEKQAALLRSINIEAEGYRRDVAKTAWELASTLINKSPEHLKLYPLINKGIVAAGATPMTKADWGNLTVGQGLSYMEFAAIAIALEEDPEDKWMDSNLYGDVRQYIIAGADQIMEEGIVNEQTGEWRWDTGDAASKYTVHDIYRTAAIAIAMSQQGPSTGNDIRQLTAVNRTTAASKHQLYAASIAEFINNQGLTNQQDVDFKRMVERGGATLENMRAIVAELDDKYERPFAGLSTVLAEIPTDADDATKQAALEEAVKEHGDFVLYKVGELTFDVTNPLNAVKTMSLFNAPQAADVADEDRRPDSLLGQKVSGLNLSAGAFDILAGLVQAVIDGTPADDVSVAGIVSHYSLADPRDWRRPVPPPVFEARPLGLGPTPQPSPRLEAEVVISVPVGLVLPPQMEVNDKNEVILVYDDPATGDRVDDSKVVRAAVANRPFEEGINSGEKGIYADALNVLGIVAYDTIGQNWRLFGGSIKGGLYTVDDTYYNPADETVLESADIYASLLPTIRKEERVGKGAVQTVMTAPDTEAAYKFTAFQMQQAVSANWAVDATGNLVWTRDGTIGRDRRGSATEFTLEFSAGERVFGLDAIPQGGPNAGHRPAFIEKLEGVLRTLGRVTTGSPYTYLDDGVVKVDALVAHGWVTRQAVDERRTGGLIVPREVNGLMARR